MCYFKVSSFLKDDLEHLDVLPRPKTPRVTTKKQPGKVVLFKMNSIIKIYDSQNYFMCSFL